MLINDTTLGGLYGVTGENVRRYSDEPIPDKGSPGLNLQQIINVARDRYRVNLANRTGYSWNDMMAALSNGARILAQIEYRSLGNFRCQAGGDFGHAIVLVQPTPNAIVVSDPLCNAAKGITKAVVRDAMADFAETTGHGRDHLWWAMTRPVPRTA